MKTYTIKEISSLFGVNRATAYKWIKRHNATLGDHLTTTSKGQRLTEEGRKILAELVSGEQQQSNTNTTAPTEILDEYKEITRRQATTIEQLQHDLRELMHNQQEERRRSDSIIYRLSEQMNNQTLMLEDMRQQMQPAVPEVKPGLFKRMWNWMGGEALNVEITDNAGSSRKSGLRPVTESKAA